MTTYIYYEETGYAQKLEADSMAEAVSLAEDLLSGADWGELTTTAWPEATVIATDAEGEEIERRYVTVTIEPPEPRCVDDDGHDWRAPYEWVGGIAENPGVWGHGGGLVYHEACVRCGCGRVTDTWAQDGSGRQGLTSTRFEAEAYAENVYGFEEEER